MRKILCIVLILIISCFSILSYVYAEENTTLSTDLQTEQEQLQQQIENANGELSDVQEELSQNLQQVQQLDEKISKSQGELDELNVKMAKLQTSIEKVGSELQIAEDKYNKQRETLEQRLVTMYESGDTQYLDVILSSKSVSDFLSNYFLITELTTYDTDLLEDMKEKKDSLYGASQLKWIPYDEKTNLIYSGEIEDILRWNIKKGRILTIEEGVKMPDWKNAQKVPWSIGGEEIKSAILSYEVQNIGKNAFAACPVISDIIIYNKNCKIGNLEYLSPENITLHGYKGSTAEKAAQKYNFKFKKITEERIFHQRIISSSLSKAYGSSAFYLNAKTTGNGKLTYTSNNKKVVTISSKGKIFIKGYGSTTILIKASKTSKYIGAQKKITIKIVPNKGSLKSVSSPSKKKLKITWKKDGSITAYQIYISKRKDFNKDTKQNTYSMKKTSTTVSGWKSKTTYYVKIRSYKTVGKTKYYGAWSSVKSIKVK